MYSLTTLSPLNLRLYLMLLQLCLSIALRLSTVTTIKLDRATAMITCCILIILLTTYSFTGANRVIIAGLHHSPPYRSNIFRAIRHAARRTGKSTF